MQEDRNPLVSNLVQSLSQELTEDLPSVTTDLDDYPPGATAFISGENFEFGETIELQVLHTDDVPNTGGGHQPWLVTDGGRGDLDGIVNGKFATIWYVNPDDSANSAFELTAAGLTSGEIATYHFTDAGSDFSIDFAAAAPQIYDHDTGGGAFEDKTINVDAVESLEGGDFAVGDIVSYYFNVNVAPNAVDQFPQTIEIDVSFLVNTTGQTGVSHRDIVGVSANYYTGELDGSGGVDIIKDTAIIDDDSTTAWIAPGTKIYENKVSGEVYAGYDTAAENQGAVVSATVRLNDLEPGEEVVLRVDTLLDALPGTSPTGNLQGFVTGARVISPTDDPVINVGNQTIPFKLTDEISGIPELAPGLTVEKVVTSDLSGLNVNYLTHTTNQEYEADVYYESVENESVTILEGSDVRFLYKITNTGNTTVSLVDLIDDNGTPSNTADDIYLFDSDNGRDLVWNYTVNIDNQGRKSPGVPITNPNGIFNILGTGFIDDSDPSTDYPFNILDDLRDLDPNGNDTDPKSLQAGDSIYVYYDVTINDANRTAIESFTNIATVEGAVDPNGGGQQGDPVIDTDTANIQILPSAATTATLSGYSYLDLNNDGLFDSGESGIVGVEIELLDSLGNPIDSDPVEAGVQPTTTRTNLKGFYSFTDVAVGTYIVKQTQPLNYYDGKETVGTNNGGTGGGGTGSDTPTPSRISSIDIQAGNYYSDYNFGELLPADISGVAYIDLNGDGNRQDTETGRSGIGVTLSGTNDLGEPVSVTSTTDSSGRYYFGSLRPSGGSGYTVSFTGDGDVSNPGDIGQILGSNVGTAGTDQITNITLAAGDSGVNYDFGVTPATIGGVISGTVYQDTGIYSGGVLLPGTDDNGEINDTDANSFSTTPSTGEKRIARVTIELYDSGDNLVATTKTDINGNYSFTGLEDDTYSVKETQPQYYDPSANNGEGGFVNYLDGQDAKDNTPITENSDTITGLTINGGNSLVGNNFGELPPASISGYVFLDTTKDRVYGLNDGESMTVDGNTYTAPNNGFQNFTIPVRNGEFDDDEFGLAGVTLILTGTDDQGNSGTDYLGLGYNVLADTTTDANGYYRFDGLRPSDASGYTVTQRQPGDYSDGTYDADSNKTFTSSDVNSGNILGTTEAGTYTDPGYAADTYQDNFSDIDLAFGQSAVQYDFPEATSDALITGKVYVDANNNGTYNSGEEGISGVTIALSNGDTVVTDGSGDYFFTVAAGTYTITETQPTEYDNGSENNDNTITGITVTSGGTSSDNNFGEVISSISGFVLFDTDGNSSTTTNDQSGLSNIEIQLLDSGGTVLETTLTAFDGSYEFTNLKAGTYSIQEVDTIDYSDASPATSFSGSGTSEPNSSNGISDRISTIALGTAQDLTDYNFYETTKSEVTGDGSPETLAGGTGNDLITGGKGEDTLTGGGGADCFYFNETSDGIDTITDFQTGQDKIDISEILATEVNYTGSDPFADGYVELVEVTISSTTSTIVQIDFDAGDESTATDLYHKDIAFLEGVTGVTSADFIV